MNNMNIESNHNISIWKYIHIQGSCCCCSRFQNLILFYSSNINPYLNHFISFVMCVLFSNTILIPSIYIYLSTHIYYLYSKYHTIEMNGYKYKYIFYICMNFRLIQYYFILAVFYARYYFIIIQILQIKSIFIRYFKVIIIIIIINRFQ